MATVLINNKRSAAADTVEAFYTDNAAGSGTLITAFTATNNTASSKTYKAYIVDSTGTVLEPVVPQKIVVKDRFDGGPSIVNQVVPVGGTIRIESSAANSLSFYATGILQ